MLNVIAVHGGAKEATRPLRGAVLLEVRRPRVAAFLISGAVVIMRDLESVCVLFFERALLVKFVDHTARQRALAKA
jgi:hypothetical protein